MVYPQGTVNVLTYYHYTLPTTLWCFLCICREFCLMAALEETWGWSQGETVSCVHSGGKRLEGQQNVRIMRHINSQTKFYGNLAQIYQPWMKELDNQLQHRRQLENITLTYKWWYMHLLNGLSCMTLNLIYKSEMVEDLDCHPLFPWKFIHSILLRWLWPSGLLPFPVFCSHSHKQIFL